MYPPTEQTASYTVRPLDQEDGPGNAEEGEPVCKRRKPGPVPKGVDLGGTPLNRSGVRTVEHQAGLKGVPPDWSEAAHLIRQVLPKERLNALPACRRVAASWSCGN
eukprot:gene24881-biopygen2951